MARIEETDHLLTISIGWRGFNGCEARLDRKSGLATFREWNFFLPFTREVRTDITEVNYIRQKSAAYPRVHLSIGQRIAMPSAGMGDAKAVVPVMQRFLGVPGKLPP